MVKAGEDITVITYGAGVLWAMEYQEQHTAISLHILDLRSLLPLDYNAIKEAVAKTGKVLLLHEDTLTGGIGGEISAWISEHGWELMVGSGMCFAAMDTPVAFKMGRGKNFRARSRLEEYVNKLMKY